ncbi:MAG: hypothetical protein ACLFSM_08055 [Thermoplasmata archaeon]
MVDERKGQKDEKEDSSSKPDSIEYHSVLDCLENLEGQHEVYEDEKFKKLASHCVRYLQEEREVPKRDLKVSIYLKFLDDPSDKIIRDMLKEYDDLTERDLWEMSKSALDHIERETEMVETRREGRAHKYVWKE